MQDSSLITWLKYFAMTFGGGAGVCFAKHDIFGGWIFVGMAVLMAILVPIVRYFEKRKKPQS
ncbi:MAG: hypothetical protein V4493_07655 [Pseudomonadota bacterium]